MSQSIFHLALCVMVHELHHSRNSRICRLIAWKLILLFSSLEKWKITVFVSLLLLVMFPLHWSCPTTITANKHSITWTVLLRAFDEWVSGGRNLTFVFSITFLFCKLLTEKQLEWKKKNLKIDVPWGHNSSFWKEHKTSSAAESWHTCCKAKQNDDDSSQLHWREAHKIPYGCVFLYQQ